MTRMDEGLRSLLMGTLGLDAAAVVALYLTLSRGDVQGSSAQLTSAVRVVLLGVLFQAVHFAEELATGFHTRFPELLGLSPFPIGFFIAFNVTWFVVWGISALGLSARYQAALFPIWFLAIACVANALAHPAFSLLSGGYFPGLITSPLVGVVGIVMLRQLSSITGQPRAATHAA